MIGLLRTYLAPYKAPLVLVLFLLFVQAVANLYLPELNADIINNGVAVGDTNYIWRVGMQMLGLTLFSVVVSLVAAYLTALFLIPLQYRWMLTMPYTLILVALLVGGIRKINAIRESEKSKA